MKKMWLLLFGSLCGLLLCASCETADTPIAITLVPSVTPQPTEGVKSMPTPASIRQAVGYHDLRVAMSEAEINDSYVTEFGSTRDPSPGKKFLWVHILLKNTGQQALDLPAPEHFSALDAAAEFKPTYGHRKDHVDYMTLGSSMDPGEELDAWLRFDIPTDIELKDLQFAFLPESTQVSVGFSSSDYSWSDHPIYLWKCAP